MAPIVKEGDLVIGGRRVILGGLATLSAGAIGWKLGFRLSDSSPAAEPVSPATGGPAAVAAIPAPAPVAASPAPAASVPATLSSLPPWRRNAIRAPAVDGRPAITIVIDDLGVLRNGTARTLVLPGPLTLSWFPFAPHLAEQVAEGAGRGHETTLHMPMQAGAHSEASVGPDPLRVDLPAAVNLARLKAAMAAVPGIVGLNNHMGTVATRDAALMELVAQETKSQGMLFLDSVVIPHSQGVRRCDAAGVPTAARDEFIDNTSSPADIAKALAAIEAHAARSGHCIAIGHPRPHTLDALEAWLPTLHGKGFALWPLSATVAWRNGLPLAA
jgi:polysaccharide deacetylase 2 family uncharacterized protein YibQ